MHSGAAQRVYELSFETENTRRLRRLVTEALARRCPGWERTVDIFWPE